MSEPPDTFQRSLPRRLPLITGAALLLVAVLGLSVSAIAQDLQGQVSEKRNKLEGAKDKRGVLTSEIDGYSKKIDTLTGQVASLRNREAKVQAELNEAEARLKLEERNLRILRERLARSARILRQRLVAIYKAEEPDALTVVLESDGFDAVLEQYEYLERIESQDADIVTRVRELRNDTRATVTRITEVRDSIAAKRRELERTRVALENREAKLASARSQSRQTLGKVKGDIQRLEGDIENLEGKIQAQLAAAAAQDSPEAPSTLPAGPIQGGSGDMIWPVNGPVVSPFGQRWGRLHAGIDIASPSGTPIRAVKDGVIALAAPYGGYGNYTCINHGGGLSSCYAHLSSFAITSGSVKQGDVIGNVGCTGHCFGDHLHFEIRVGGNPTDPMGYL
ncbi:MAG TPA: peptidoglycan DD-metalloendopeptidase family protein [Solirubrobacterales bacterium]|nr:peptidoglycan DD-metalloendopeptidase family protein [Solirubrobacterales bacterium]